MTLMREPKLWGIAALALAAITALVAGYLYVSPPGQKIVTFFTRDASSVHPGDQVRIAGISVGTVKNLSLGKEQVQVRTQIQDDAFVGDRSSVDIRMLTVVGGYYVNIVSIGERPLGGRPIPIERVTMPYNLVQTLADSTKITQHVDARPVNQSLNQLAQGFAGTNVSSLSAVIDAGNSVIDSIERQRGQISAILNLSDEYIRSLANYRDGLQQLVGKISIVEQTLSIYSKGFGGALAGLGDVLNALAPVGVLWENHRDDFLLKVRRFQERAQWWTEREGSITRALRLIRRKIERVADAQNAPPEFLATDLCLPVPGSPC